MSATNPRRSIARILRGYSATGLRIGGGASLACGVQRIGNFKNRVEYWCSSAFIRGPQDLVCVGSLDQSVPECARHRLRSRMHVQLLINRAEGKADRVNADPE